MAAKPLRVGVVGLGYWGPNLLRVLLGMREVRVTHLCDADPERLERWHRDLPSARATTSYEALLDDSGVDAVVLATPVGTHFELASQALAAGRHAFVEKPLACSVEDADTLIELAGERGLALMCGHTFLYSPAVRAVKELLAEEALGRVYFITSSRVNLGLHQRDVSVLWDLGPHDFSMLVDWLDETPEWLTAAGRDSIVPGIPDVAFVTMQFPSGVVANLELSWLAPSKLCRTVIVGSEKMVDYEDGAPEPVRIFNSGVVYRDPGTFGEYHLSYRAGDILSPQLSAVEPLAIELEEFVRQTRAGGPELEQLGVARRVVALAEAADRAYREGGRVAPAETVLRC